MLDERRVYDPDGSGLWTNWRPIEWHRVAWTGMDFRDCYIYAVIDGGRLRVQHGENPEAVRWFTLDELNCVGRSLLDGHPVWQWCEEIHRASD